MKWLALAVYIVSVLHVHLRGKARLPLRRQLVDHSTFMAPINAFMHLFSRAPTTPFVPGAALPELAPLQQHWRTIRAEAEGLRQLRQAQRESPDTNLDACLKHGLKDFYLKWYDAVHASARQLCPQTFALLQSIPSIRVAAFAELPPGGGIGLHRDPFAGWVRYHLGLSTPGSTRCFIEVDGERHCYRDGLAMVFDETYLHWAANDTAYGRLILLCDIERPMRFRWAQALNHALGLALVTATSPPHENLPHTGLAGWLARAMAGFGRHRRRLKAWSPAAYRAALGLSGVGLLALVWWL